MFVYENLTVNNLKITHISTGVEGAGLSLGPV